MTHCHEPDPNPAGAGRRARGKHARATAKPAVRGGLRHRVALLGTITAAVVVGAAALLWPTASAGPADRSVEISMAGFSPPRIQTAAGQPLRLELVNNDSSMHTDGGGWHQLAIPGLGLDFKVGPRSRSIVEIPAAAPVGAVHRGPPKPPARMGRGSGRQRRHRPAAPRGESTA